MKFKVSLAQINPKTGDIRGNGRKIVEAIRTARERGADLVVLPEMCLTGYCLDEKLLINLEFLRANQRCLIEEILPACQDISAIVGFIDFDDGKLGPDGRVVRHNAAAVLSHGRLLQVVRKRLLPAYRYFDDKRYFVPGEEVEPVTIPAGQGSVPIGVLICEDLWDESYALKPCALYRDKGARYLFCINASPFVGSNPGSRDGKRFIRDSVIRRQIRHHALPVIYVNTVGVGDNGKNIIPFDGFSVAYDRSGQLVGALPQFRESQEEVVFKDGESTPVPVPPFSREEEIYQALVMSVRDYYDKIGIFTRVLEAISGGIDSALGAAIAYEAMGRDLLSVYSLPSRYNSATTLGAARKLARNFELDYHEVPIQKMVDAITEAFEEHLHPVNLPVTLENLQARVRGLIMMAESNDRRALLLTNGNQTEIALGYATLYGDMVGGLSVIGDLSKPDVYALARHVNRRWGRTMIPEEIFSIAPSAELKEDQEDPFDYDVVGPLVNDLVERGSSPSELNIRFRHQDLDPARYPTQEGGIYEEYGESEFSELTGRIYRSLNSSVYKRLQGAPIVVVSARAFGFDLRETIINGWRGGNGWSDQI